VVLNKMFEKLKKFKNVKIKKLVIGLGYTAALTEEGLGLSYTLISRKESCTVNPSAGSFAGRTIEDALEIIHRDIHGIINKTLLIALFNSTIDFGSLKSAGCDAVELMDLKRQDEVYMIGYFEPLVDSIKTRCASLKIIEERHGTTTGRIEAEEWKSDANIITSTSLINGTFEDIAKKCEKSRVNCLMGPSTPLDTDLFKEHNITFLAGLKPLNYDRIFEIVSEGGGTKLFNKHCEKIVVKCGVTD